MAIVLEEEKNNNVNIINLVTWLVVIAVIVALVYYIFFNQPQLVDVSPPANLQTVDQLSKITFDPNSVVNNLSQGFRQSINPPVPGNAGRPEPLMPP